MKKKKGNDENIVWIRKGKKGNYHELVTFVSII